MNRRFAIARYAASALTLAFVASGCSGGGSRSVTPVVAPAAPLASPTTASSQSSSAIPYGAEALKGATLVGPAKLGAFGIDVYMTMRDQPGLVAYARAVSDPSSGLYRHFLTPQQLGDRFGAPAAGYSAAIKTLNGLGIATSAYPQRQMIRVFGPQTSIEKFVGAKFGIYTKNGERILAPMTQPKVDGRIAASALRATIGYRRMRRNIVPLHPGHGITLGYAPQQVAAAFDYTGAYGAGYTGKGIDVGIIGTGPIADGDPRITGIGDVAYYRHLYGITGSGTVTQVSSTDANVSPGNPSITGGQYSSGLASPPPVTSETTSGCVEQGYDPSVPGGNITDYTTCNPEDIEAQLDTEQVGTLAPDASTLFYIAYNPAECYAAGTYTSASTCPGSTASDPITPTQEEGLFIPDDEIQQAIGDNAADVLSISFGGDEPTSLGFYFDSSGNGFGPTEFASLASEGIATFASTGDFGAQGCAADDPTALPVGYTINSPCISYPASDPNVVGVGGVNAPIDQTGKLDGPLTTWGVQTSDPADNAESDGGGGGVSTIFQAPVYQIGLSGIQGSTRNLPDVSGLADGATGMSVVFDAPFGPQQGAVAGTSIAAPQTAAMWALVLQACSQTPSCAKASGAKPYRLGNPNALLYAIYSGKATSGGFTPQGTYASSFYDVQFGSNATIYQPDPDATENPSGATPSPGPTFAAGYTAGVGYDPATGLGVPFARHLIKAIVGI